MIQPSDLTVTDGAMQLMAEEYCNDHGAREIRGNIQHVIRKVITEWERGLAGKPLVVDEAYVRSHLKAKKRKAAMGF